MPRYTSMFSVSLHDTVSGSLIEYTFGMQTDQQGRWRPKLDAGKHTGSHTACERQSGHVEMCMQHAVMYWPE